MSGFGHTGGQARIRRFDGSYRWFLIRANPLRDESGNILKWYGTCIDIEDRKRVEETLRARELSWQQIVDNIPGLVATTGALGEVEFINRQTLEYFGKTNEELQNWSLIGVVHPGDLPRVIEARTKSIEGGCIYEVEHRCRRADGVYRWFQVRGLPVRDTEDKITAWHLLLTDIDDRKRAEQKLLQSEADFRTITNNIPGFVHTMSPAGEVEFLNRQILEYFGKTSEELKDWTRGDVCHPDDLPRVVETLRRSIEAGRICDIEVRCRRADGAYRWFQSRGRPVRNAEGQITAWYFLLTDIDDRKKAEQALQSNERNLSLILNAIPTLIHVLRTDGSVLYVNQAVLDYTGLTREDVQKEDYRARVFHPEDVERLREERREALTRAVPFENEQRVLSKEGEYRWFLCRYNPLVEEGRVCRWYTTATEIESRKQEEERVRQENVRLEERTRIARELHDTLLQTVQGASMHLGAALFGIAEDSPLKRQMERSLQLMSRGIEEGRNAIQGLRSPGSHSSEDLIVALSRIRQELQVSADIDFRVIVTGRQKRLPAQIQNEIYRIGREALVNAFNHSGAKRVELELEYSDNDLRMRVRDNGCGIDPQVLDKGLDGHWGLASMRERATRLGGLVKVLSSPTAGTEVQLCIPSSIALELSPPHHKSA